MPKDSENDQIFLEDQILHVDKMASIGAITSGLAHEINNPLGIILGYTQNLIASQKDPEILEDLRVIEQEVLRCSKIIEDLMSFARNKPAQKEKVAIQDLVNSAVRLLDYKFQKHKIHLEMEIDPYASEVIVDRAQFQQVFMNFFLYLIPTLTPDDSIQITSSPQKHGVEILISDNGQPVTTDTLRALFKTVPFNAPQKGLFGLIVARQIVEAHLGTIEIDPQTYGNNYRIFLPKTHEYPS